VSRGGVPQTMMDDGYKSGKGLYICTESFTLDETILLVNILKSKFGLNCSYHKVSNGNRIYIFSTSKEKLINLVQPYFLPHFYYKLDLDKDSYPEPS